MLKLFFPILQYKRQHVERKCKGTKTPNMWDEVPHNIFSHMEWVDSLPLEEKMHKGKEHLTRMDVNSIPMSVVMLDVRLKRWWSGSGLVTCAENEDVDDETQSRTWTRASLPLPWYISFRYLLSAVTFLCYEFLLPVNGFVLDEAFRLSNIIKSYSQTSRM